MLYCWQSVWRECTFQCRLRSQAMWSRCSARSGGSRKATSASHSGNCVTTSPDLLFATSEGLNPHRPQYWEIYKLRQVIGISLFFLSVDILGGVFSFLSLFFREDLDIAAFVGLAPSSVSASKRPS